MSDILWRRLRYFLSPQLDIYKAIAPRVKGLSVLDVGCGTGAGAMQFHNARRVTGSDVDAEAIAFANFVFPGGEWVVANIVYDVSQTLRWDAIVMIECLEHIADWRTALSNVRQMLNGKLYISARNAAADLRKNELHEREWTAGEFKAALSEFFSDVKLYNYLLTEELDETTHQTPLVAVCSK